MGSVITKNIPLYEICTGNPAKYIKKRFEQHIIDNLLLIKWWEMSEKKIKNYSMYFNEKNNFEKILQKEDELNGEI
jgi:gamma-glutamyl-gamma-aminobutyrate hydrolase PuuD